MCFFLFTPKKEGKIIRNTSENNAVLFFVTGLKLGLFDSLLKGRLCFVLHYKIH